MTGKQRTAGFSKPSPKAAIDELPKPQGVCRACARTIAAPARRCAHCASPRLLFHPELHELTIAHMDCDAFFAAVEKRDHPEWRDRPVIVGGGARGVVSTACYQARLFGVHSAMPMFRAKRACPQAVIVRPDGKKYAALARRLRARMRALTPQVQPVSIDEAYLDLRGTRRLHRQSPAQVLARFARELEDEFDLTVSIGLSHNKFLAKLASERDKPRGFFVIGRRDCRAFLAALPMQELGGVGRATLAYLRRRGVERLGQIQAMSEDEALQRFGKMGQHWWLRAHGIDEREVRAEPEPAKSLSTETTFAADIREPSELERRLWLLCEKLALRCRTAQLAGSTVVLKLKRADFRLTTRHHSLGSATRMERVIFAAARPLLRKLLESQPAARWRLMGVGLSALVPMAEADLPDLGDPHRGRDLKLQTAIDGVRSKFGAQSLIVGRSLPASQSTRHDSRRKGA